LFHGTVAGVTVLSLVANRSIRLATLDFCRFSYDVGRLIFEEACVLQIQGLLSLETP
jgi:hypothetical protein